MSTRIVLSVIVVLMLAVVVGAGILRGVETAVFAACALAIVFVCAGSSIGLAAYTRKKAIEKYERDEAIKAASVIKVSGVPRSEPLNQHNADDNQ